MFREVNKNFDKIDIAIASAAVSDFKPKDYNKIKLKKKIIRVDRIRAN